MNVSLFFTQALLVRSAGKTFDRQQSLDAGSGRWLGKLGYVVGF